MEKFFEVTIISYDKKSLETFDVVCCKCTKSYTLKNVEVFHNCKVAQEDCVNQWKKFYLFTKKKATCPHCGDVGSHMKIKK